MVCSGRRGCLFFFDRLFNFCRDGRWTFTNRRVAVDLEHLGVVWIATNVKANELTFLGGYFGGIEVANRINNAKRLFCGRLFVLGMELTPGEQHTYSDSDTPTIELSFFHEYK